MSFLGSIIKTGLGVVTVPVAIVKDVATLGGSITDNGETYTGEKLRNIVKNADRAIDEIDGDKSDW